MQRRVRFKCSRETRRFFPSSLCGPPLLETRQVVVGSLMTGNWGWRDCELASEKIALICQQNSDCRRSRKKQTVYSGSNDSIYTTLNHSSFWPFLAWNPAIQPVFESSATHGYCPFSILSISPVGRFQNHFLACGIGSRSHTDCSMDSLAYSTYVSIAQGHR